MILGELVTKIKALLVVFGEDTLIAGKVVPANVDATIVKLTMILDSYFMQKKVP